jgi:hypothetical protein
VTINNLIYCCLVGDRPIGTSVDLIDRFRHK